MAGPGAETPQFGADQVRRLCSKFLTKLGDQNVILGTSDSTAPGTPEETLLAESGAMKAE